MQEYTWAANKIKVAQAINALKEANELGHKIEINEESIKAEYIKRGGLLIADKAVATGGKPTRRRAAAKPADDEDDEDEEDAEDDE